MLYQTQPNSWSCMATAAANVLDMPVAEFFRRLGHDDSEKVSDRRRGVHVQEVVDVAWDWGYWVMRIDLYPQSDGQPPWPIEFQGGNWARFKRYCKQSQGVLLCRTKSGRGHALVNDVGHLYDPAPGRQPFHFDNLEQQELYPFSLLIVGQRNEL